VIQSDHTQHVVLAAPHPPVRQLEERFAIVTVFICLEIAGLKTPLAIHVARRGTSLWPVALLGER